MDPEKLFHYAPPDDGGGAPPAVPAALAPAETPASTEPAPPTWLTQVSPGYRDNKALHKYAKLNDLVDAHLESESRLSHAIVVPDPKTAKPEDVVAFKKSMGIPEKPEDYAFEADKFKGTPNVDKLAEGMRAQAVAAGLTKGQAGKMFEFVASLMKVGMDGQTAQKAELQKTFPDRLLESVGKDPKKAEEVTNRMTAFMIKHIGDAALVNEMKESGILFNPTFAAKIAEISRRLDDAPYVDGQGSMVPKGPGTFGKSYAPGFEQRYGGNK